MKIIQSVNYSKITKDKKTSEQKPVPGGVLINDKVSFSGSPTSFKDYTVKFFDKVNSNFFATFLIVDTFSMIIPRILIGLGRDKEKTGKVNYKAGAEEAGREIISGPSMFIIPMAIMTTVQQFKPAVKIPLEIMESLGQTLNDTIKTISGDIKNINDKKVLNREFAGTLFDRAFGDFELDNKEQYKDKFTDVLNREKSSDTVKAFDELVAEINNKNKKIRPLDEKLLNLGKNEAEGKAVITSASDLFANFKRYSNDVVEKISKKEYLEATIENCKTEAKEMLSKLQKNRSVTRYITTATAFFSVGGFLLYLPKLYQKSGLSPAQESAELTMKEFKEGGVKNEN